MWQVPGLHRGIWGRCASTTDGRVAAMTAWWTPSSDLRALTRDQQTLFCLACVERLLPSYGLQMESFPESVVEGWEDADQLVRCIEDLWSWTGNPSTPVPECLSESDVEAAESAEGLGMSFLVADTFATLWYAYQAAGEAEPRASEYASARMYATIDALLAWSKESFEQSEVLASHPRVVAERTEQEDLISLFLAGAPYVEIQARSRRAGLDLAGFVSAQLR